MSVREIELAVNQAITAEGFKTVPFSMIHDVLEEKRPDALTDMHGFSFLGEDRIYINDSDTASERVFTELHEAAHLLTGSEDEATADRIATFCCRVIQNLTGCRIDAEPLRKDCVKSGIFV